MGYELFVAVPMGAMALLLAASGAAVLSLSLIGLGMQLVGLLAVGPSYRPVVAGPGAVVLLLGLALVVRSQRPSPPGV